MSDIIDSITPPPAAASPVAPGTPDRKGNPFDPARHIPKMHPKHGYWITRSPGRGGRKEKPAAPSSSESASLFPADSAPSHSMPPPAPTAAPAPSFDDIEKAAGPTAPVEGAPGAGAAPSGDAALPAESSAEIGVRALYAITGVVIGDHKAATAGAAEHKSIVAVATAYIRHRGWTAVGIVAVGGTLLAYLLQDGRREPIADRLKKVFANLWKKKPQNVTPVEGETIEIAPAVVEAKPAAPAAPAEPVEKY